MTEELLYRYFQCQTTPDEECSLADWLDADPRNRQLFEEVHQLFLRNTLSEEAAEQMPAPRIPLRRTVVRYAAAAAAALALAAGGALWGGHFVRTGLSERIASVEVPAGQRIRLKLEDGTAVWLNAGSRLEYPAVFAPGTRRVKIEGEAMFEVTHDARRPFVVETFASRIEVLGTRFNVVADPAQQLFTTALVEGSVKVTNLSDRQQVILRPDQTATLVDGHMQVGRLEDPTALRWTEGIISLKGLSFAELMAKFERAYDVRIVIARDRMPRTDFTSGKIRISDGIDHALRILQHGAQFTWERDSENNTITIR